MFISIAQVLAEMLHYRHNFLQTSYATGSQHKTTVCMSINASICAVVSVLCNFAVSWL